MPYFTQKTWTDRLVEFAGRRTLKNVATNETATYDITRAEGNVSREGDAFSSANMNGLEQRIAEAFAAVEADVGSLPVFTSLNALELPESGVSIVDIYSAMPMNSLVYLDANNSNMVTDIPEEGSGFLEILKIRSRNVARYTRSISSGSNDKGAWYGTFKWSPRVAFNGWVKIATNTDIDTLKSTFQAGVDTLYNKCVSRGATPSDKTPTAISGAIDTIYTNRYTAGRSQGQQDVINNPAAYGIPLRSGYQKLVSFTQWPSTGRTITTTITDYARYREISQNNIVVGIRNCGGHGTNEPSVTIQAYCNGYDANSGTVSIFISGDIQSGNVVLSII
ncbi:MAG TPA: hypothetical protein H9717_02040 [Candidatus Eisenbergiella merdipullorum]|uniref:Uncharacterized protein n=1 Tax=Candidatus Eisenbergiella merdipullorum TaxID=2838553 RepID=A0A9D2I5F4_9FIRM|nr:hypothetical protein [Candidatus Eisenbergiella merdipullorum]